MINLFKNDHVFTRAFGSSLNSEIRNTNQVEDFYARVSKVETLPQAAGACPAMCINAARPASASVIDDDPNEPVIIKPNTDENSATITAVGLPAVADYVIFLLETSIIDSIRKDIESGQDMSTKEVVRELFCISEENKKINFVKVTTLSSLPKLEGKTDNYGKLETAKMDIREGFEWNKAFVVVYYNGE